MPTKLEARVDKHDQQIAAIQKLILTGTKMLNENRSMIRDNNAQIKALIKSQLETDRILKDLLGSPGRRDQANGHGKAPDSIR